MWAISYGYSTVAFAHCTLYFCISKVYTMLHQIKWCYSGYMGVIIKLFLGLLVDNSSLTDYKPNREIACSALCWWKINILYLTEGRVATYHVLKIRSLSVWI